MNTPESIKIGSFLVDVVLTGAKLPSECIENAIQQEWGREEAISIMKEGIDSFVFAKRLLTKLASLYTGAYDAILRFDALATAEEISGKKLGEKINSTAALGFRLMHLRQDVLAALSDILDDSEWSCDFEKYGRILKSLNFELVYEEPYVLDKHKDSQSHEKFQVWHRPDGLLLCVTSFWNCDVVNSAHLYYNWKPNKIEDAFSIGKNGHFVHPECVSTFPIPKEYEDRQDEFVWSGGQDARVAIRRTIQILEQQGKFLPKWIDIPGLWLVHSKDEYDVGDDSEKYDEVKIQKFKLLPTKTQEMIGDFETHIRKVREQMQKFHKRNEEK